MRAPFAITFCRTVARAGTADRRNRAVVAGGGKRKPTGDRFESFPARFPQFACDAPLLSGPSRGLLLLMASVSTSSIRGQAADRPSAIFSLWSFFSGHGVCWTQNSHGFSLPSHMARLSLFLPILGFAIGANAAPSVTLAWKANSEPDLAGYRLYFGRASHAYHQFAETSDTTATISNLIEGTTYFFAATAYDTAGVERRLDLSGPEGSLASYRPRRAKPQAVSLSSALPGCARRD